MTEAAEFLRAQAATWRKQGAADIDAARRMREEAKGLVDAAYARECQARAMIAAADRIELAD